MAPSWSASAPRAANVSFVDPTLQLPGGAPAGSQMLVLKVDGLSGPVLQAPEPIKLIKDLGIPSPPEVTVTFTILGEQTPGPASRLWTIEATVAGLPDNVSQKRYARVQFEDTESILEYTLTNKHPMAFAWTLRPPPTGWSLTAGRVASVALSMGPVPATNVRLIHSSLIEQSTKVLLGSDQIQICHNAAGPCQTDFSLAAGSANQLFVRVRDEFEDPGTYQGAIVIACAQKPEGDSFNLTIYNSSCWRRLIGVLVIVLGVVVAWFSTVYARARTMHDQALMPAVALLERLKELSDILDRAPRVYAGDFAQTKAAIERLRGQLDPKLLKKQGYLPPKLPIPYVSTAPKAEEYKAFLQSLNDPIGVLIILVRDGLPAAWSYWQPGMGAAREGAIRKAITAIDRLAPPGGPAKPAEAQAQVGNTLRDLRTELGPQAIAATGGAPATPSTLTYERLTIDVERISALFWVVWALLTSLAGAAILVLAKDGFGVRMDYIYCLFWGFGIPAAGQSFMQLTAGSVTSALGISLVKG